MQKKAEEVWTIGTVGQWPKPIIKNDNLRNVPHNMIVHPSATAGIRSYHPETYFFEDGKSAK